MSRRLICYQLLPASSSLCAEGSAVQPPHALISSSIILLFSQNRHGYPEEKGAMRDAKRTHGAAFLSQASSSQRRRHWFRLPVFSLEDR